jgi:hypothetical protein
MTQEKSNINISVFWGGPFEYPQEEAFLNRLRRDLVARGVGALVLANFFVMGNNGQRQIDFCVLTDARLTHVALKSLRQDAPVTGRRNGPWIQDLGDNRESELDPNPFHQAHQGTFAISDMARRLMERGDVPMSKPFYRHVDTVVCIDPDIPAGSTFDTYTHVDLVGYEDLLDRLGQPGPRPQWATEHWDAVIRNLGVYPEENDTPVAQRRRESSGVLAEYRHGFVERTTADTSGFVPLALTGASGLVAFGDFVDRLEAGTSLGVVGESGHGKSRAAAQASLELTAHGRLVISLDAGEYTKGRLAALLGRATAPFSTQGASVLAGHAGVVGDQIAIVVDGFNQCPPQIRDDLLEELAAFRLRYPSTLLVTSSTELPEGLVEDTLRTALPDAEERAAILVAHGATATGRVSEAFTTPFELAVAAACGADLAPEATETDLYDAYVHQLAPTQTIRNGLRSLALALVDDLRTSMRLSDAATILGGAAGLGMVPEQVDAVLQSRLLVITQGQVRFTHELFGRFLASEALVLRTASGSDLVEALTVPSRADLRRFVVALERDPERRAGTLASVADTELYVSAVRGEMGLAAAEHAQAVIKGVLADATFAVGTDEMTLEVSDPDHPVFPKWSGPRSWSPNELAMLGAAGHLLPEGHFVAEVCELCDRTDDRFRAEAVTLEQAGSKVPVTTVVSALVSSGPGELLAATVVIKTAEFNRWSGPRDQTVVSRILAGARARSWSRLYLAATLCGSVEVEADPELLPSLVRGAWSAGGYHLQLQAMMAVHLCGHSLDDGGRDTMGEILQGLETSNVWLQSSIVEALAAVGGLDVELPSVEQLRENIRTEVLAMDDGPEAWRAASGVYSNQYEPEDILGPYYEAVHTLTDAEQRTLFIRAAQHVEGVHRSWVLEHVVDATPTGDAALDARLQEVFVEAATGAPAMVGMLDDNFDTHLHGVRGLARLAAPLPPCSGNDAEALAWHLVDQLIMSLESDEVEAAPTWDRILEECPWPAIDVLFEWRYSGRLPRFEGDENTQILARLFRRDPDQFRRLFEWGLTHLADAGEPIRPPFGDTRENFMIRALGGVGDASTAEVLRPFMSDPQLAKDAVAAIRDLNG